MPLKSSCSLSALAEGGGYQQPVIMQEASSLGLFCALLKCDSNECLRRKSYVFPLIITVIHNWGQLHLSLHKYIETHTAVTATLASTVTDE